MKVLETTVEKVGNIANELISNNMIVTFKRPVPKELENLCVILSNLNICDDIKGNDILCLCGTDYKIEYVGDEANKNLKELGHITLRFNNSDKDLLPGSIYLTNDCKTKIENNMKIEIRREDE